MTKQQFRAAIRQADREDQCLRRIQTLNRFIGSYVKRAEQASNPEQFRSLVAAASQLQRQVRFHQAEYRSLVGEYPACFAGDTHGGLR